MINLIQSREEILSYSKSTNELIGLVPTMGNLHKGHLKLIEKSLSDNDITIVTIFVNPKQFGPNEDYEKYPRTLKEDLEKIESILSQDKEVIVFAPSSIEEIFPSGFNSVLSVKGLDESLCGTSRPGHFDGVCTVVYQLFNLTRARNAYFGLKDFQQSLIIRKLVKDLMLPVKIHLVEIVRDDSGLALSSRNKYLSSQEKREALILSTRINELKSLIKDTRIEDAIKSAKNYNKESNVDYFEILDSTNLSQISKETTEVVIAGAMFFGKTRLIDNTLVKINA